MNAKTTAREARKAAEIARIKAASDAAIARLRGELATAPAGVNLRPEYKWTIGGRAI